MVYRQGENSGVMRLTLDRRAGSKPAFSDLAFTDPLTGLGNQRRFFERVERIIDERAEDPVPFAVCILDLDGFKPINDLFGRKSGDDILAQVAIRLRSAAEGASTVARFGPDEFAFLYPMIFSEGAIIDIAKLLIELISAPYDIGERTARLSASVGCSLYHSADDSAAKLIDKAESALYQAKKKGRGRVIVYSQDMEDEAVRVARIEQALRRAIASGDVEPHFQPIVDLGSRRVVGFETLARWTDRDLGSVPPSVFIPIAEDRAIIAPLSQLILQKATAAARFWPKDLFLSFNLSPSQLADHSTATQIRQILEQTGFPPERLEIELTETGLMGDPETAADVINELKQAGIRVSLDDFGTGQSSLGRLRDFQFDKIKIDRAFVTSLLDDKPSEHIIRAILAMCEGLEMAVVAEGIESEAQAARLASFGCAGGQGYLFGRPVDARSTAGLLRALRVAQPQAS